MTKCRGHHSPALPKGQGCSRDGWADRNGEADRDDLADDNGQPHRNGRAGPGPVAVPLLACVGALKMTDFRR